MWSVAYFVEEISNESIVFCLSGSIANFIEETSDWPWFSQNLWSNIILTTDRKNLWEHLDRSHFVQSLIRSIAKFIDEKSDWSFFPRPYEEHNINDWSKKFMKTFGSIAFWPEPNTIDRKIYWRKKWLIGFFPKYMKNIILTIDQKNSLEHLDRLHFVQSLIWSIEKFIEEKSDWSVFSQSIWRT